MLICLATLMVNLTTTSFNDQDFVSMTRAQHVCKTDARYAGCLTKFIKRKQGIYRAICGENKCTSQKKC